MDFDNKMAFVDEKIKRDDNLLPYLKIMMSYLKIIVALLSRFHVNLFL